MYTYAWYHWLTFFYIYCFFGWIFESTYVSLKQHHFVNRGFLRLPMLPLYGTGAVMMLWVSLPVKGNLLLVYCSGVVAATLLEYVTGYIMERLFKVRYWDYSSQKFNLHGYICLTSSIAWGFLTIFMTEIIHRPIERFVLNLPPSLEWCLLGIVSGCFVMDTIQSTREALSLAKTLESVSKLRADLEEMQVQLALLKAETEKNIENAKEELRATVAESVEAHKEMVSARREALEEAVAARREELAEAVEAHKEAVAVRREELSEAVEAHKEAVAARREELAEAAAARRETLAARISTLNEKMADTTRLLNNKKSILRPSILRRNPTAVSRRFANAWKELFKE